MPYPDYRASDLSDDDDSDGFNWDPDREARLIGAALLLTILLAALIAALSVNGGFLTRVVAAAIALVVGLVIVRSRIFSTLARWLALRQ